MIDRRFEVLGDKWLPLVDNPEKDAMALLDKTLKEGGTREPWNVKTDKTETVMMAWPELGSLRVGAVMRAKQDGNFVPITAMPLLEGIPQDLTVEKVHVWANGACAYVAACRNEGAEPLIFQTMFYYRDRDALMTPGVRHSFLLGGMAYGVRKALLDEMTITEGPQYEDFAKKWLEANPGKTRLDVPQLKLNLRGETILMASNAPGDYQMRARITAIEEGEFDGKKYYMMPFMFGADTKEPLMLMLFVSEKSCRGYVPKVGDDIDAIIWLQGRIVD
jgi:hypothetical protein